LVVLQLEAWLTSLAVSSVILELRHVALTFTKAIPELIKLTGSRHAERPHLLGVRRTYDALPVVEA
jgi:hypothetical protein